MTTLRQISGTTVWGKPDTAYEVWCAGCGKTRLGVVCRKGRTWWAWKASEPESSTKWSSRALAVKQVVG